MTEYTYLDPKEIDDVRNKFISWLNDNLEDPYEQRRNITRSDFIYGDDLKIVANFPRIQMDIDTYEATKISTLTKTNYCEEETITFIFYYHNQRGHKYTFKNGKTLSDAEQCMKYLIYLKSKIKANADKFEEYCHKITFGSIPKPIFNKNNATYMSMLPMMVRTYRR